MNPLALLSLSFLLQQSHRQLVPLEQDRVRIGHLGREGGSEVIQSGLGDDTSVSEPSSIGSYSTHLGTHLLLSLLEGGGLDNLSISVSNGFSSVEHLDFTSGFGISVKVLSCCGASGK